MFIDIKVGRQGDFFKKSTQKSFWSKIHFVGFDHEHCSFSESLLKNSKTFFRNLSDMKSMFDSFPQLSSAFSPNFRKTIVSLFKRVLRAMTGNLVGIIYSALGKKIANVNNPVCSKLGKCLTVPGSD